MSLPKYVVNFDELTDKLKKELLGLIDDELRNKYPQLDTNNIEALLEDLKELLPSKQYRGLKNKIDKFIYNIEGMQKIEGRLLDIPAIRGDYKEIFKFDKDIFLTGLHINQTGWKKEDTYDLEVNKNKIINKAATKEIGEHKYFNTFYKVNANTPISFILDNRSGNSRQVMVDLEYIQGTEITEEIKPPKIPTIDDIPNEWDVAVVMSWGNNSRADLDLHGFIGERHVYYGNKKEEGFYLNFDCTTHKDNNNSEILSVKGYKNKKLNVYIKNFNNIELKEPVNIKIYNKRLYGNRLLKEFTIDLENNDLKGVCSIDLKTLGITNIGR